MRFMIAEYWWIIVVVFGVSILMRLLIRGLRNRTGVGGMMRKDRRCGAPRYEERPSTAPDGTREKKVHRGSTEALVCERCGAGLDDDDLSERSGLLVVDCPYCKTSYTLGEMS